ncbi:type VII secretion system-associated protein [Streptomyces sp. NPDC004542]|uniref:type VII secretion system-associated protein n=1 Tax=Streptomyces sp. NPDC004542 TaxID=3154281 RepID=UPI0033A1132B
MTDLTHLDSAQLKAFLDEDVATFIKGLKEIRQDLPGGESTSVRALSSLVEGLTTPSTLNQNPVLAIGTMAADDLVFGKALVTKLTGIAKSADDIFLAQQTLFQDLKRDLQTTLDTLLKNQGDSLIAIDAEKLLDIFADVDSDLGSGAGAGSNGSSTAS